ncbi:MAG: HEAT repeat domain-containing protein [Planctomycetota bacterium]
MIFDTLRVPRWVAVLISGLAFAAALPEGGGGLRASPRALAQGPGDRQEITGLADAVGEAVRRRLRELGADDWQQRDEAGLWLVTHSREWMRRIPQDWRPATAEARWRWRWVQEQVSFLTSLPALLAEEPRERIRYRVSISHEELGEVVVEALAEALHDSHARVRQRALEILGGLPGVDLKTHAGALANDPSPWVRRSLYALARERDRGWAAELLGSALGRREESGLQIETVRAVHRLGDSQLLPQVRRLWTDAGPSVRGPIALALADAADPQDREILHWMLDSDEYPLQIAALRTLREIAGPMDLPVLARLLESPHWEIREGAMDLVSGHGDRDSALWLLCALESGDSDLLRFVAERFIDWQAEDYYGDLDQALLRLPPPDRFLTFTARGDRAVPVLARPSEGEE